MRHRTRILLKRTLRNLLLTLLIPAAALLTLRLAWGLEAAHRLATVRAQLKSRDIPTSESDIPDPKLVPASQNAVTTFTGILDHIQKMDASDRDLINNASPAGPLESQFFSDSQLEQFRLLGERYSSILHSLDPLAQKPAAWPREIDYYYGEDAVFYASSGRELAEFLAIESLVNAHDHRDTEALRCLIRILTAARIIDHQPMILPHLVASAMRTEAVNMFERIEPTLDWIQPALLAESESFDVALRQAEAPADFGAAAGQETLLIDWLAGRLRNARTWWLNPLADEDSARAFLCIAAQVPAARANTFPRLKALAATQPSIGDSRYIKMIALLSSETWLPIEQYGGLHFDRITDLRAARMLLVARRFQVKYARFPNRPDQLVPEFLSALPIDPYSPEGTPLHYRLDPDGPTIWSVGKNGKDDADTPLNISNGQYRSRKHPDIVYGAAWGRFIGVAATAPAGAP